MPLEKIKEYNPMGIIFTGGPNSVFGDDAPLVDKELSQNDNEQEKYEESN